MTEHDYKVCLDFHAQKVINLSPFKFETYLYNTKEFKYWWSAYYKSVIIEHLTLLQILTNYFYSLQKQKKKGWGMQIKEIWAFQ